MIVLTSMDKLPHSCMSCPFQKNQKTPFCRAKRNWYRPLENVPASFGFYIKEWDFSEGETPWNARARWCPLVEMPDRKTEPTISKMEQVGTMSCAECKHRPIGAEICEEPCHYEPQTDWHYDDQDATWYPYKHKDEPQQESCATCKHALGNWDGESNNCGRCCGADRRFYEPKTEPQTERSE